MTFDLKFSFVTSSNICSFLILVIGLNDKKVISQLDDDLRINKRTLKIDYDAKDSLVSYLSIAQLCSVLIFSFFAPSTRTTHLI